MIVRNPFGYIPVKVVSDAMQGPASALDCLSISQAKVNQICFDGFHRADQACLLSVSAALRVCGGRPEEAGNNKSQKGFHVSSGWVRGLIATACNESPVARAVRRLSLRATCRSENCRRRFRDRPGTSADSGGAVADETRYGSGTRGNRPRRSGSGAAASHRGTASATGVELH